MWVYVIRNRVNGMEYVGTTTRSLSLRMSDHRYRAKVNGRGSPLYRAIREHGIENFAMEPIGSAITYEDLLTLERLAIRDRNTVHPHGYNLVKGGPGNYGWRMSAETRRKIAEKATGRIGSMRGRTMSAESRAKMSAVRRATPSTPAQLAARRANGSAPESRAKISAAAKARWAALPVEERARRVARLQALGSHHRLDATARTQLSNTKRRWWANLTPEQRQRHIHSMKEGRKNQN